MSVLRQLSSKLVKRVNYSSKSIAVNGLKVQKMICFEFFWYRIEGQWLMLTAHWLRAGIITSQSPPSDSKLNIPFSMLGRKSGTTQPGRFLDLATCGRVEKRGVYPLGNLWLKGLINQSLPQVNVFSSQWIWVLISGITTWGTNDLFWSLSIYIDRFWLSTLRLRAWNEIHHTFSLTEAG